VLSRINNRGTDSNSNSTLAAPSLPTRNSNKQQRALAVATMCDYCMKEHVGANEKCWNAHPELMPIHVKKRYAENAAKKAAQTAAAASCANVSLAPADNKSNGPFGTHVYASIASFVSLILLQKATGKQEYKQRYCYNTTANRHVFNNRTKFKQYRPVLSSNVHGSTGSTSTLGVGTVCLEVIKYDGTTEEIYLKDVLHCPDFATNVVSQAPFKRHGVYYHSGMDKLFTKSGNELAYLPEIDGIPNFLVVTNSTQAPAALSYASLVAFRSSSDEPSSSRPAAD
jgi:hypothetical protein